MFLAKWEAPKIDISGKGLNDTWRIKRLGISTTPEATDPCVNKRN